MVYYRKYRPQTISELDLASVRDKLTAILSSKELPHAFLFTGSKGLGKTSSARILAKAINCTNRKTEDKNRKTEKQSVSKLLTSDFSFIEPCNKCEACISITDGSNIDVLEIDAASNGGVEEMRVLRERVKFASSTLRKKVYIIDEVHMLSTGAFNALLKTLEEPPSHVVFILATTELWKLPPTVVSRTFQVQFEKPTEEELVHSLERIVRAEGLKVEKGVLAEINRMADGSFRDGAKLLEELVLNSNGSTITKELVGQTFRTAGLSSQIYELLKALEARDAKKGLTIINKLSESGVEFKVVTERIVDHLRGLLMLRNGIESSEKDVPGLTVIDIKNLLTLANEAYGELKVSVIPQLPLELLSVKFCIIDTKQETEVRSQKGEDRNQKLEDGRMGTEMSGKKAEDESSKTEVKGQKLVTKSLESDILPRLIQKLNETNKPGAALLRSAKDARVAGSEFEILTPFPIHAERLMSEKVYGDILMAVESILGKKMGVVVRVFSGKN